MNHFIIINVLRNGLKEGRTIKEFKEPWYKKISP